MSFSFTENEKELFFRLKIIFIEHGCFSASDYEDREARGYADYYAGQGSIDGLMWCKDIGEDIFYSNVLEFAVSRNHKEVIIWLRQQDCLWGHDTKALARHLGYDDLVEWLTEQGCPSPKYKLRAKAIAH